VARTSRRNFLTAFRAIGVDDATRGPDVSDDVQLVYVADDLRQRSYIYAGAGTSEASVVGQHSILSLECRNQGGLEIQQLTMNLLVPADGTILRVWTSGVIPVITGPAAVISALRTTGLQGLPAAPLGVVTSGTILTAAIPAAAFRYLDNHGFTHPFFINQAQFFNVAFGSANQFTDSGIRWRELRLFP